MIGAAFGLGFVLGPALGGMLGHSSLRTPAFPGSALTFANLCSPSRGFQSRIVRNPDSGSISRDLRHRS